jgi:hypothetical protein
MGIAVGVVVIILLLLLIPWVVVRRRGSKQGDGSSDPQGNLDVYGNHG